LVVPFILSIFVPYQLKQTAMKADLIKLFTNAKHKTGFDHTEWIETNRGDLRLFCPTDWVSNEEGEIQAETEQGEVLSLSELTNDEIESFINLLS